MPINRHSSEVLGKQDQTLQRDGGGIVRPTRSFGYSRSVRQRRWGRDKVRSGRLQMSHTVPNKRRVLI